MLKNRYRFWVMLLLGVFGVGCTRAWAQHWLPLPTLGTAQGLPGSTVHGMATRPNGQLLWATDQGLCVFDCARVRVVPSPSSRSAAVAKPVVDAQGRVWLTNFSGQLFEYRDDRLRPVPEFEGKRAIELGEYPGFGLLVLESQAVWQHRNGKWFRMAQLPASAAAVGMLVSRGGLYINTRDCDHLVWDGVGRRWLPVPLPPKKLMNARLTTLNGRLLAVNLENDGLTVKLLEHVQGSWKPFADLRAPGRSRFQACGSTPQWQWVCTSQGLWLRQVHESGWTLLLQGRSVTDALFDAEGVLWVSTQESGVHRFVLPRVIQLQWPWPETQALSIAPDGDGKLWVLSTQGHVGRLVGRSVVPMAHLGQGAIKGAFAAAPSGRGMVAGLLQISPQGKADTFTAFGDNKCFADLGGGLKVIGISDRLCIQWPLGMPANAIPPFRFLKAAQKSTKNSFGHSRVRCMAHLPRHGELYIGFEDGLMLATATGEHVVRGPNGEALVAHQAEVLRADTLAVRTANGSVFWVKKGRLLGPAHNVAAPALGAVQCLHAQNGTLVLATRHGLLCRQPNGTWQRSLGLGDGLPELEFRSLHLHHDTLWAAGPAGLFAVPMALFTASPPWLPLRSRVFGLDRPDSAMSAASIRLKPYKGLGLQVMPVTGRHVQAVEYAYRLMPTDTSWTVLEDNLQASFANLAPGDYVLEVRARLRGSGQVLGQLQHPLQVLPFWWRTTWFWLLATGCSVALVAAFLGTRLRQVRRRLRLQRRLRAAQLSALRAKMNPHFLFNALNSLQDAILRQDTPEAHRQLTLFSRLLRSVTEDADQEYLPLAREIRHLDLFIELQQLRFEHGLNVHLDCPASLRESQRRVPSMMLAPFVENAIEHGLRHQQPGLRNLSVVFREEGNCLHCTISDTGIGRAASTVLNANRPQHRPTGMLSTHERIRLYNEQHPQGIAIDVRDPEPPQTGTIVQLRLPLLPPPSSAAS